VLLRQRPQGCQSGQVLVREFEERAPALDLLVVELEPGHEIDGRHRASSGCSFITDLARLDARREWRKIAGAGMVDTPVTVLLRFSRMASSAAEPGEVLPHLVAAVGSQPGVDAVAVLQVVGEGLRLSAAHGLPAQLEGWSADAEELDTELGRRMAVASGGAFSDAQTLLLVSSGDLYGALVLLSRGPFALAPERIELVAALADLAALAIGRAAQHEALSRSYMELRTSREVMARSERMRSLGQMAAGVAHDLGNILNPMGLELQLLSRRLNHDREVAGPIVERLKEVVQLGGETLARLRSFSRQTADTGPDSTDLNRLLASAVEVFRPQLGSDGRVELRQEPGDPPEVRVRGAEIVSALVNLLINAAHALSATGGVITVRSGSGEDGGWVEVADDGPGMPPEVERRVFEPFFTTKPEGTGLGLAMVYGTVERHGGKLTLATGAGQGTRLRLWFPRATL
jgi:signal transduction histidine kinase